MKLPISKSIFLIALLFFISLFTVIDIVVDYFENPSISHALIEVLIILCSIGGAIYFIRELAKRRHELERIKGRLLHTEQSLSASREKVSKANQAYSEVIHQQFRNWGFTPSEFEVASLMLKGLSFDEIASVRNTKEKTVRQQASAIYSKSGISGRHEFAAWFFEDFLN